MGVFNPTEEEKAAKKAAKQAEKERQEQFKAEQATQEAEAAYLASPVGQAETAHKDGQTFFQLAVNTSEVTDALRTGPMATPRKRSGSVPRTCSARSKNSAGDWSTLATCSWRPASTSVPRF